MYVYKPKPELQAIIDKAVNLIRPQTADKRDKVFTVCAHIRGGGAKLNDPDRQGGAGGIEKFVRDKVAKCAHYVSKGRVTRGRPVKYFVAADAVPYIDMFKTALSKHRGGLKPGQLVSGADIGNEELKQVIHVGRQANQKGGILRMFLDFEVMRRECDNMVLAPSTFSAMAYMTSEGREFGVQVCFPRA